jgi:hypothetical protein
VGGADEPRPLRKLGLLAIALLGLATVANFIALGVDLIQLGLVTDIRDGARVDLEELNESDDRVQNAGILQSATYVVCIIGFLVWYGRAYRNIERLGAQGLRWGKRWAIAYWFIPIVNLFRPKQVMNDIWRGSDPELPRVAHHWQNNHVPALFHWWWALWIVTGFISNILFRRSLEDANTPDELVSLATGYVIWDVVDIVPALLLMLIIWKTTKRQEERRERLPSMPVEPAPAPFEHPERPPAAADAPA